MIVCKMEPMDHLSGWRIFFFYLRGEKNELKEKMHFVPDKLIIAVFLVKL